MLYDGCFVKDPIRYIKLCNFSFIYRLGRAMILLKTRNATSVDGDHIAANMTLNFQLKLTHTDYPNYPMKYRKCGACRDHVEVDAIS